MIRTELFVRGCVFITAVLLSLTQKIDAQRGEIVQTRTDEGFGAKAGFSHVALSGNLPAVLAARPQPYLVISDIYVPSGKTVRIEPGTVLLFREFTGLHVEGRLIASGEANRRIVFSSENDATYNPSAKLLANPYDWNGIFIHESGLGSELSACTICYSVYGINALTRFFKLRDAVFHDNGRADLTIEGQKMVVRPGEPFSYAASLDDARKAGVPVSILIDPLAQRRNVFRYGGIGVFLTGAAIAAWCGNAWLADINRIEALQDVTVRNENSNLVKNTSADFTNALKSRNTNATFTIIGASVAVAGGIGFAWSFAF